MSNSILRISDGTLEGTVNLLSMPGWLLKDWNPSIPEPKGGGTFRNSPLMNGRNLAYRKLDNVIDTFNMVASGNNQNDLIENIQKLQRLLEKALTYWTSQWQNVPVWIEARSPKETNTRYATIVDYRLNGFGGPYRQPFYSIDCKSASEATLVIEHTLWQETQPGEAGNCVELHNETEYPAIDEYASKSYYPSDSEYDCTYSPDMKEVNLDDAGLIVGYNSAIFPGLCEAGIVFYNVDVPAGATLLKASLILHETILIDYPEVALRITGHHQGWASINSVTLTNGGSGYRNPLVYIDSPNCTPSVLANIIAVIDALGTVTELNIIESGRGYCNPVVKIKDFMMPGFAGSGAAATATVSPTNLDAAPFDGTNEDFTERERTDSFVNINLKYNAFIPESIDVTDIVHEIMSNPNWTSGDNLGMFISLISGQGFRSFKSWDNTTEFPELLIEWTTEVEQFGRQTTCAAEVFAGNKSSQGSVNFIFCSDADGVFSGNMVGWDYTDNMPLFQDAGTPPAPIVPDVGDYLYFGSCKLSSGDTNYGPFSNLIFDLYAAASGIQGVWEYYNGSWTEFDVTGSPSNQLCGNEASLQDIGVGSIVFSQPDDWIETTVTDGTYNKVGFWVRFKVESVKSPVVPYQWHRDIYTCINPYIDINAANVPGDVPALARIVFEAAACQARSMNTLVLGLRSLSRGEHFNAYINASDKQQQGITFTRESANLAHHLENAAEAPTGRALDLTGFAPIAGTSNYSFVEVCSWTISSTIATEFLGIYHAYVRGYFSATGMRVRLRVVFGEEHNVFYSDIGSTIFLPSAYVTATATDLGQLVIMPSSSIHPNETVDKITIYLEMDAEEDSDYGLSAIYDIVLIPCDEWAGNFGMQKATATAALQYGMGLDVDGITTPRNYRAIQTKNGAVSSGTYKTHPNVFAADWSRITSGEPIFQQNSNQRLWFMQYMYSAGAAASFETMGAIRADI